MRTLGRVAAVSRAEMAPSGTSSRAAPLEGLLSQEATQLARQRQVRLNTGSRLSGNQVGFSFTGGEGVSRTARKNLVVTHSRQIPDMSGP